MPTKMLQILHFVYITKFSCRHGEKQLLWLLRLPRDMSRVFRTLTPRSRKNVGKNTLVFLVMLSLKQVGIEEPSSGIGPVNWPMTPGYNNDNKWSEAVHQVGRFSSGQWRYNQFHASREISSIRRSPYLQGKRLPRWSLLSAENFIFPHATWALSQIFTKMAKSLHMKQLNAFKININEEHLMVTPYKRLRGMKVGERIYEPFMWHMSNGLSHQAWHLFLGCRISTLLFVTATYHDN